MSSGSAAIDLCEPGRGGNGGGGGGLVFSGPPSAQYRYNILSVYRVYASTGLYYINSCLKWKLLTRLPTEGTL